MAYVAYQKLINDRKKAVGSDCFFLLKYSRFKNHF